MPESIQHIDLVRTMARWVVRNYASEHGRLFVLADLPESQEKPAYFEGFRPDLYAVEPGKVVVLGEAKTAPDLERPHTEQQLIAFMRHLGGAGGGVLVVAVPWPSLASANNLAVHLRRKVGAQGVSLRVLTELDS